FQLTERLRRVQRRIKGFESFLYVLGFHLTMHRTRKKLAGTVEVSCRQNFPGSILRKQDLLRLNGSGNSLRRSLELCRVWVHDESAPSLIRHGELAGARESCSQIDPDRCGPRHIDDGMIKGSKAGKLGFNISTCP